MDQVMERYLTQTEQRRLLATVKGHAAVLARRDYAWIRLLLGTGMRIGEFSKLNLKDARFACETGWVFIPAANRKGREGQRRDHRIPIAAPTIAAFRDLMSIHTEMGGDGDPETPLVLSRKHQARLSVRAYQDRMTYWCALAGIEHASPHWMRHTRAMNVMRSSEATDPRGVVQALLGHTRINSTGVYTHVSKEDLLAAVEKTDGGRKLRGKQVAQAYREAVAV